MRRRNQFVGFQDLVFFLDMIGSASFSARAFTTIFPDIGRASHNSL